jgi:hypothetical protein
MKLQHLKNYVYNLALEYRKDPRTSSLSVYDHQKFLMNFLAFDNYDLSFLFEDEKNITALQGLINFSDIDNKCHFADSILGKLYGKYEKHMQEMMDEAIEEIEEEEKWNRVA